MTTHTTTAKLGIDEKVNAAKGLELEVTTFTAEGATRPTSVRMHPVKIATPPPPPPDPEPEPEPTPEPPAPGTNILGVDLTKRPRSGPAWDRMLAASKGLTQTSLANTDGAGNGALLAAAYVAAATGDEVLRAKVLNVCRTALNGPHARTLEQARNLPPIAVALSALEVHELDSVLIRERDYKADSQGSVIQCHEVRPNNWGTCSGLARIAIDLQTGDAADLAKAIAIFRGWLGETALLLRPFAFGDSEWQANPAHPVGINPKGSTRLYGGAFYPLDGILPDDQRRQTEHGGDPAPAYQCENYVFQALGEVAATAILLDAAGSPAFRWSDSAVVRAYLSLATHHCVATKDDGWQVDAAHLVGVTIDSDGGHKPGKSFGWVDWLYLA